MSFINIPGNVDPIIVLSSTGTGAGTTTFTHNQGVEGNYPSQLYPAVFIFAITDILGSFSGLQVNLEWSPITPDVGTPQFQTVGTWTPLANPVVYFACSSSGIYRLNCTSFTGGTSFNAYASIASTMPQGTGGGGGGGGVVTQGTIPWIVAGQKTPSDALANPTDAVDVESFNLGWDSTNSVWRRIQVSAGTGAMQVAVVSGGGGGTQYADGTTQATPTGTVALGKNPSNVLHSLALDASGNLEVVINAPLPAGTNVIGHVIVDSGSITVSGSVSVSNFPATQNVAGTTTDGTTTETNFLVVGGESNDATAQYQPIPLGPSGRSIIVEGTGADASATVGNPVFVAGANAAGTLRHLPVYRGATDAAPGGGNVLVVGGADAITGLAQQFEFVNAALIATIAAGSVDSVPNLIAFWPGTGNSAVPAAVVPYVFNGTNFDRLREGSTIGSVFVQIGDSSGSGAFTVVKPASTTPLVTDPALVVTLSPNSSSLPSGSNALGSVKVTSSPLDEYGNKVAIAEDTMPWRQALLDEMRAVRLGLQVLCHYINPGSVIQYTPNSPIGKGILDSNEPDLIAWAQSIRDGADEVIQG